MASSSATFYESTTSSLRQSEQTLEVMISQQLLVKVAKLLDFGAKSIEAQK